MYDDDEKTPRIDRPDIRRHQRECIKPGGRLYELSRLVDRQAELTHRLVLQMAVMVREVRERERSRSLVGFWVLVAATLLVLLGR